MIFSSTLPTLHLFLTSFQIEMLRSKSGSYAATVEGTVGNLAQCPHFTNRETEAPYESIYSWSIDSSWHIFHPHISSTVISLSVK